jgi:ATP-dependent helicase/nuclease subunit A
VSDEHHPDALSYAPPPYQGGERCDTATQADCTSTKPRLTPQQETALAVQGSSVALRAGAGCGKTTVLTERFLRHLDGPERRPLGQVVALTFTEKAARELRERVRKACRLKLEAGEDTAHWRAVLRGLEAAPISTFHSFCAEVLRRFPVEAGVEPGFTILEESITPSVRDRALNRCLRNWLSESDPDLVALAAELGLEGVRDALSSLIDARTRGDLAEWATKDPEQVVEAWEKVWTEKARPLALGSFAEVTRGCVELLRANPCTHPRMSERRAFLLEQLPRLAECAELEPCLDQLHENARVQGGGNATHWPSPEVYEQVKARLDEVRTAIKKLRQRLAWNRDSSLAAAAQGLRFARLAVAAIAAFEDEKQSEGLLDFDDLQLKVRDLLCAGTPDVRERLAREMPVFLVDEFQDTDPIQGEIISRLAGERHADGALFLVGDIKQSIYRFRNAEPRIFDDFQARFPAEGLKSLTENFRSVPGILDFVNALFAATFQGEEHRLGPSPKTPPRSERPAVEFVWAHEADDETKPNVVERRKTEARWLARLVRQRIHEEAWQVRDEETGALRAARPSDVVMLFRTLNDAAAYESALEAEGLDYYIVGGSAFFGQQEVLDVINLLSAIEDPHDALALAATLRGPFGCVSDDGLYWFAMAEAGDLTAGFAEWNRITDLDREDRRRAGRLFDLLARWRSIKDRVPIAALLDRALDESGYEAALLGEFLGPRKRANVRKLVRLARRFDTQGGFTLADFVAKLRADLSKPSREEQAATTDEQGEAVRLMTIHQAKGLEFPVVIVADLDRDIPHTTRSVLFERDLGVLTKPPEGEEDLEDEASEGVSLGLTISKVIEAAEEKAEAHRLFYVATTRAQDVLVLSAGSSADEDPKSPAMALVAARFDRATGACTAELPEDWVRPLVRVVTKRPGSGLLPASRRRSRPKLLTVSLLITRTIPGLESPPAPGSYRPRYLNLDPALGLSPSSARLDRLIRSALAAPDALRPDRLEACVLHAARLQAPAVSGPTVERTLEWLGVWIEAPLARQIAAAAEVHRAVPWTLAWPPDATEPTVFEGCIDFLFRDDQNRWTLVALACPAVCESRERLRVLLSAQAARELGVKKLASAWRVRLGPEGGSSSESQFDEALIDRAIASVLL